MALIRIVHKDPSRGGGGGVGGGEEEVEVEAEVEEEPAAVKTSTSFENLVPFPLVQDLHVCLDLHEPFAFERA